ncbi:histidine--tRNA ligase [Candidatus Saccharibacteria bacterium]|nr:MAG: histidine--tRNA ligase [Candidatus Saccharibacteria bacterium]
MAQLSTQPYKGARDFYPEDKRIQNYIFSTWRHVVESYGYEQYDAPLLEPLELYAAKSGQEIVSEQTYQFVDRGGRTVAIRPEMTPTVSRMVAARRQELAYPARWYSIPNLWRYERPQKGRLREHWQLNVDMFGVETVDADLELMLISYDIMKAFGANDKMFKIRVNSRRLINIMMAEYLELDVVQSQLMIKLFDKKNKVTPEEFRDQALAIFDQEQAKTGLKKIAALIGAKTMGELPKELLATSAVQDIQALFTLLRERGVTNAVFDITLMRGFDYYTDIVFEVFDTNPENARSLFGGGRYDGLVSLFGVQPVPTVGFGMGDVTIKDFLETHNLMPKPESTTDVYMIVLGNALKGAQKLARELREEGVKVAVDITGRKLDKQIKSAVKMKVPFMLFVGEQELQDEVFTLKDVAKSNEEKLGFGRIVTTIKDYRRRYVDDDDL